MTKFKYGSGGYRVAALYICKLPFLYTALIPLYRENLKLVLLGWPLQQFTIVCHVHRRQFTQTNEDKLSDS